MAARAEKGWTNLAFDSWMLGAEASTVIWMRSLKMMAGGQPAMTEMHRMVSEKVAASLTLMPAVMAGGFAQTPQAMAALSLAHYRKPVRANRRRLSARR